jgi:hypothetical protein
MTIRRLRRPRDPNRLAKLTVDVATDALVDAVDDGKDERAVEMGHKGGPARRDALTPQRRSEIARKAAEARWKKRLSGE